MSSSERTAARIAPLDGMRAFAVAAVVATHALPKRFPGGVLGVDVFFVISGFVITAILLREQASRGRVDLRGFYGRRFLRLGPALVVFVVLATALGLALGYPHPFADAAAALTFTSNAYYNLAGEHLNTVGHSWSLAVEEQFYLAWPPLVALALTRHRRVLAATAVAFVSMPLLNAALLHRGYSGEALYRLPHTRLPELLAGAAAAVFVASPDRVRWVRPLVRNPLVPWVLSALLALQVLRPMYGTRERLVLGFAVVGVAVAWIVLHVVHAPDGLMARILAWRPFVHVGFISYGLYLWHWPAIVVGNELGIGRWRFLVSLPLMVVLAELSWRLVEVPANRYKERRYGRGVVSATPIPQPRSTPESTDDQRAATTSLP